VHEVENDEQELHRREDDEGVTIEPFGERQVDGHDLDAGDDREEHRDLHVDLVFADVVRVVVPAWAEGALMSAHENREENQRYSSR
jgi:hypothetical protein